MMRYQTALALAAALLLAACAASPPEHFYSLSNGMGVPAQAAASPGYYVELPAVTVPQQVARYQMVVSTEAGRVDLLEHERWSAMPAAELSQSLSLAITGELGTVDVFRTPTTDGVPVYRISTNVQRFESAPGRYALIDAVWSVRLVGGTKVLTCRSVANETVGAGFDALVAGHRRAVARIAADMSKGVRWLATGAGSSCQ